MLIDFCHYSVNSKIKADKLSVDGYEVANIISENRHQKNQGFMCESFVKPPVNITVQFPCNVAIYRIVIDPVIGQQQSCDMKLFSASHPMTSSWLYGNKNENIVKTDGILFNFIGSLSQESPSLVCFQNPYFRERNVWRNDDMQSLSSYPSTAELKSRKPGALCHASHVTLCVMRARGGRSVAIKRLEIWGMPSIKVANELQFMLRKRYCDAMYPRQEYIGNDEINKEKVVETVTDTQTQNEEDKFFQDGIEIPEDFVDHITFDIMSVPMLLPSGKNIDQSTLERYVNIEASWGRPPNDPFTGVPFTQGRNAITNSSLKSRIDQFVLRNSQFLNVARTLGHSRSGTVTSNSSTLKSSRLLHNKIVDNSSPNSVELSPCLQSECSPSSISSDNYNEKAFESLEKTRKRKRNVILPNSETVLGSMTSKRKCFNSYQSRDFEINMKCTSDMADIDFIDLTKSDFQSDIGLRQSGGRLMEMKRTNSYDLPSIPAKHSANTSQKSNVTIKNDKNRRLSNIVSSSDVSSRPLSKHCDNLTSSLDDALTSALSSLPSFTRSSTKNSSQLFKGESTTTMFLCCTCHSDCQLSSKVKYRLPCTHVICRDCVQGQQISIKCGSCDSECTSAQLVRVFD